MTAALVLFEHLVIFYAPDIFCTSQMIATTHYRCFVLLLGVNVHKSAHCHPYKLGNTTDKRHLLEDVHVTSFNSLFLPVKFYSDGSEACFRVINGMQTIRNSEIVISLLV